LEGHQEKLLSVIKCLVKCIRSNIAIYSVAGIIVLFPFANMLDSINPLRLFGKSAWVVFPVVALGFIYLTTFNKRPVLLSHYEIFAVSLVIVSYLLFIFRDSIYVEGRSYLDFRYIATSALYLGFASRMGKNPYALRIIAWSIVWQGLLVSLVFFINVHYFPEIMIISAEDQVSSIIFEGERTRSMLLGASISANQILCAMIVMLAMARRGLFFRNPVFFWCAELLMLYAVTLGGSRYPAFVAIFIILLSFSLLRYYRYLFAFLGIVICLIISLYISEETIFYSIVRMSEDYSSRFSKLLLSIQLLQESAQTFLIGVSSFKVEHTYTLDGLMVSDNSYALVALQFGVPFAGFYFILLLNTLRKYALGGMSFFVFCYLLIGLGVTNAILWEPWVCIVMFSLVVVSRFDQVKVPVSV
jgi:hypothetical protein